MAEKGRLTPFGEAFYEVLASRGISTKSQERVAEELKALGYPNEKLSQADISNWTTKDVRPPKQLWAWMEENLRLSTLEKMRLAMTQVWGEDPGAPS